MTNIINNSNSSNDSLMELASTNETGISKIFSYNGSKVTFKTKEGVVYVNATEMARPFNKKVAEYLRLPSTKELIEAEVRKSHLGENQLITTLRGGINGGGCTWLHEDIAIDLAQWLSIDFKLWCNDRIKELLTNGKVELNPKPTMTKEEYDLRNKEINSKIAEIMLEIGSRTSIPEFKQIIDSYAFNTLAGKEVLPLPEVTEKTYSATEIGKILGVSANKIGKLANQYNLKVPEFGKLFYDKSRYSNKEVETFRYYNKAIDKFRELLK